MTTKIKGRVWKYGDDVNTDVIFPGKYTYTVSDPAEMAQYALEDLDLNFAAQVQPGDVIIAGKNWGNGSSREQAVTCLKQAGVGAIVAKSFARIYSRNCINGALPAIPCAGAVDAIQHGEVIEIDLAAGSLVCAAGIFTFPPFPPNVMTIIAAGGLIEYTRQKLAERNAHG
ncbi:MAG: 3-isopropylmalate dehydratase [Anaerolineae bacterium]|nr:3-isopropylmalate dehydratase [Anaerolineae bacterium]